MKIQLTILLFVVSLSSCSSKPKDSHMGIEPISPPDTISLDTRMKVLTECSNDLRNEKSQVKFLRYFPNSFEEFQQLFGYEEIDQFNAEFGPLYEESGKYIEIYFLKLEKVDRQLLIEKVINISVGAHWEADAVSHFQSLMCPMFKNNMNLFLKELSSRKKSEIKGFWYFYFDCPHPSKEIPDELAQIKSLNKQIYELILQAHQEVLKVHKGH